jgi:homoserine dehydrogenase
MELRLGLIGCGTVGSAFGDLLAERGAELERLYGLRLVLDQVAVAHPDRPRPTIGSARVHGDPARLAEDPGLDIVVEATGALGAAVWLRSAIERGATAVTANKQALVHDPQLLRALACHDPRLQCEAAAAAAVPIVRALRDSLAADKVLSLRGVLNGTTTFVLSRIEEGSRLTDAVTEAQRAGYAEADPSDDLQGRDAAAKLAILCTVAWREPVGLDVIAIRGLGAEVEEDVRSARRAGRRMRLVARARLGQPPAVSVESLEPDDPLASTSGVDSMVEVQAALAGRLVWSGPGAGGRATASALLADTLAAARTVVQERAGRLETEPAR